MSSVILENLSAVVGGDETGSVVVSDGRIVSTASSGCTRRDCSGLIAVPGFIDIHIHGAVGIDVNTATTDGLLEVARFLARNGVTAWMPTLVPDADENYGRAIAAIDRLMEIQSGEPVAQAVGVHYEGVFASEHMCGALRAEHFRTFSGSELSELPRLKNGFHLMTFAPEIEGGIELTAELVRQGWIASIGHTRADSDTLDRAFSAGARHLTHFFNAMTPMHHREVGVVGWGLANADATFDIIADGIHVDPKMLEVACRLKTPERVSLISDSIAATGLGDGEFDIWGETISVTDGRTKNGRGSIAGSVITMLDAFNRMRRLGFSVADVSRMASLNPAKLLGIDKDRGAIEIGKRADLVILDQESNVQLTVVGGRL